MEHPIAMKLRTADIPEVHQVSIEQALGVQLRATKQGVAPAIVVTRSAAILEPMSVGMIDTADVIAVSDGDWAEAVLVVLPKTSAALDERQSPAAGDSKFLQQVQQTAPSLAELATQTVAAVRKTGVDGELVEAGGGRWVNRPLNTFTLKVQPRAANLHFTLYGNPNTYDADGFLLQDQNSYSRGWVRNRADALRFAQLVRLSHDRRKR